MKDAEEAAGQNGKVIVLYSSSNTFEMANLEDDAKVDAILWMGRMGDGGIKAVGEILSGKVNPSGKTVDEWTRDFTNDPTYANKIVTAYNDEDGNSLRVTMGSDFMDNMYEAMMPGSLDLGSVDYEEDIYLGYKWYETYWAEASAANSTLKPAINGKEITAAEGSTAADDWYSYNVVYPYGYGLSYTSFSYTLKSLTADTNDNLMSNGSISKIYNSTNKEDGAKTITAEVAVKNEGDVAGKETVEIYVQAPYESGGIEKPYYTLVGFGKTNEIKPGETDIVTITFNIQDFASFDYSDANNNDYSVYELDAGDYTVHVMGSSSHENIGEDTVTTDAYDSATFSISGSDAVVMDLDDYSGNEVEAWFSGSQDEEGADAWKDDYYSNLAGAEAGTMYTPLDTGHESTLLSRSDFDAVRPTAPTSTIGEKTLAGGLLNSQNYGYVVDEDGVETNGSKLDVIRSWWGSDMYIYADKDPSMDSGKVWEQTSVPTTWTQGTGVADQATGMYSITLNDMVGKALYDSDGNVTSDWDNFMNQLTWEEILLSFCGSGV